MISLVILSSQYYKNNSKLPVSQSIIISFYFLILVLILPPIIIESLTEEISKYIFLRITITKFDFLLMIIDIIIIFLLLLIILFISSQGMTFKTTSFQGISTKPSNIVLIFTCLITGYFGVFSSASLKIQKIIIFLGIFFYFISISPQFLYGGFIDLTNASIYLSTCLTSSLMLISFLIFTFKQVFEPLMIVFGSFLIWFISFLLINSYLSGLEGSNLDFLDEIFENEEIFGQINSPNTLLSLAMSGYRTAHPICLNWTLFKKAIEKWENNVDIWYAFAKLVAIYPEENNTLAWIFNSVISLKLKGSAARSIKLQSLSIAYAREFNLSPTLKTKLNNISKHIQATKHKLRHVWDIVIQGNISEVETSTKKVFKSIEQNDSDFIHLFSQFPNNRFVSRAFGRYLIEVKGDHKLSKEISEKSKLLHRGFLVSPDRAHELGLNALKNLPDKINSIKVSLSSMGHQTSEVNMIAMSDVESETEETEHENNDIIHIDEKIKDLSFPAIRKTRYIRFYLLLILFIGLFGLLLYLNELIYNDIISPLYHIYRLASTRQYSYMISAFNNRYIFEQLLVLPNSTNRTDSPPIFLGSNWNLKKQISFIMGNLAYSLQSLGEMRSFKNDVQTIIDAKKIIFNPIVNYSIYKSENERIFETMTLQGAMLDMIIQINSVLENESMITPTILNTSSTLNPYANVRNIADGINDALSMINQYLSQTNLKYQNYFFFGSILLVLIGLLIYLSILFYQINLIQANKIDVYRCLTSLPKNTVSSASENLRMIKNEADGSSTTKDSELSRQEENILKVFSTGGITSSNEDPLPIYICTLVQLALYIMASYLFYTTGSSENTILINSAPHLDSISGSFSLGIGGMNQLMNLIAYFSGKYMRIATPMDMILGAKNRFERSLNYYHFARYGGKSGDEIPFLGFMNVLEKSSSQIRCADRNAITNDVNEILQCYRPDSLFMILIPVANQIIDQFYKLSYPIDPSDEKFTSLWKSYIFPLYETLFAPMFEAITPTISKEIKILKNNLYIYIGFFLMIGIMIEIYVQIHISKIEKHMKNVLYLLQHCPTAIVLQTPKVISVLSGKMTSSNNDTTKRDSNFYEKIFTDLPDAVYVINSLGNIESINKIGLKVFKKENLIGINISELFNADNFIGDLEKITRIGSTGSTNLIFNESDTSKIHYEGLSILINEKHVITLRDITQRIRYNTLIQEERAKSDSMLASILPPSLVHRVQNGETNISFSVQSASIIFVDIVEFTPWCSSLPAATVMSTLNALFKKFDEICSALPLVSKMKCIGDCYMAAGGIFSEINHPADHAKESVLFGLEALKAVSDLNKELNQNLRIRIGINTGGPIVAGVLGVGKPTFEIFGPAINMAQQMEHHGIPNQIQISRPVYELVYGGNFIIKERGSVEVKEGKVITYLVTGKQ